MRDEQIERLAEAIGQWQLDVALVGADMDFEPAHLARALAPVVDAMVAEALREAADDDFLAGDFHLSRSAARGYLRDRADALADKTPEEEL